MHADFAELVLDRVNQYRARHALDPLRRDAALDWIASDHSRRMAQRGRVGHDGFAGRFEQARRASCVENLAADFDHADALVAGWRASPAHHANLLAPQVRWAGIASVAGYVTLLACE